MSDRISFSRVIKYVDLEDGSRVELPLYCSKRITFYEFDKKDNVLEIRCKDCNKFFKILKLEKVNGVWAWQDIHKESEYHFMSEQSGYAATCMSCKSKTDQAKNEPKKTKEGEKQPYTVFLTEDNKRYLQLRKIVDGIEITDIINELIDKEKARYPLEVIGGNKKEINFKENENKH